MHSGKQSIQVLGLALHVSLVLYLEYKQYRIRIVDFISPFTISVDAHETNKHQQQQNKKR